MPSRPMPRFPEPDTENYWEGTKSRELRYQQCNDCSAVNFSPTRHCRKCGSANQAVKVSKGEGTVYTYSVVRQSRNPSFKDLGAYSVAYIDLDEGFRMLSCVTGVNDPTTDIKCGQRVKVDFEAQDTGDYLIPVFRPA
ncbi:MAG: Zn-ribbon domain-containing OB-fold protein [Tepidiformaceae bacterium]